MHKCISNRFLYRYIMNLRITILDRDLRTMSRGQQKSAGVNSFAQIKKDLKPYMGQ